MPNARGIWRSNTIRLACLIRLYSQPVLNCFRIDKGTIQDTVRQWSTSVSVKEDPWVYTPTDEMEALARETIHVGTFIYGISNAAANRE